MGTILNNLILNFPIEFRYNFLKLKFCDLKFIFIIMLHTVALLILFRDY